MLINFQKCIRDDTSLTFGSGARTVAIHLASVPGRLTLMAHHTWRTQGGRTTWATPEDFLGAAGGGAKATERLRRWGRNAAGGVKRVRTSWRLLAEERGMPWGLGSWGIPGRKELEEAELLGGCRLREKTILKCIGRLAWLGDIFRASSRESEREEKLLQRSQKVEIHRLY